MCTVSIVPRDRGFRLACNRDERLARPAAGPPQLRRVDDTFVIWPSDPGSGGTWIGANDRGIVAVLLNRNPAARVTRPEPALSRGTIVPQVLQFREFEAGVASAMALAPLRYEPFTLIVLHRQALGLITNVSGRMTLAESDLSRPVMFTSSSLGDHLVDGPRRALFTSLVQHSGAPLAAQAAFHRHSWSDRREISVFMSRLDAATVSRTVVDSDDDGLSMRYRRT